MLAFISFSFIANAQETDNSKQNFPNAYNRISLSYTNVTFSAGGTSAGFNGGGFHYIHGFSLSSKLPIYLETGASLNFSTKDYGSGSYGGYGTLDVPINCAYRLNFPNSEFIFVPSLGLDFKGNIIGTTDVATDTQEWFNDYEYKRFQLGWQISAGMEYRKLYFALQYGTDFIQIAKKVNTGTFSIKLGLNI